MQSEARGKHFKKVWKLEYIKGDLFTCPSGTSLAHCISVDCRMGQGIAVEFRNKFGGIDELKRQAKKPGSVAVLERGQRYVYYLITKEKYFDKPTYENLKLSLESMLAHCLKNSVTQLSMPRIGCGLDGLQWERVSEILYEVFANQNILVRIYTK